MGTGATPNLFNLVNYLRNHLMLFYRFCGKRFVFSKSENSTSKLSRTYGVTYQNYPKWPACHLNWRNTHWAERIQFFLNTLDNWLETAIQFQTIDVI